MVELSETAISVEGREDALEAFANRLEQLLRAVPVRGPKGEGGWRPWF